MAVFTPLLNVGQIKFYAFFLFFLFYVRVDVNVVS